jgi:hypothetical protein
MLTHQVDYLMHRLRGLNNKGYQYCEETIKQAPSYKEVRGRATLHLFISFSVSALYVILPFAIFFSIGFNSALIESSAFALCLIPSLVLTFYNLAKWSGWLSFVEEVNTQSYRFRRVKKAAANSRHSSFLIGIMTVISSFTSMQVHLLVNNGEVYVMAALLPAIVICSYLGGLATIRTAFMCIVSEDISRFKGEYEG